MQKLINQIYKDIKDNVIVRARANRLIDNYCSGNVDPKEYPTIENYLIRGLISYGG